MFNLLVVIFIILIFFVIILMFGLLFFVSGITKIKDFIVNIIFRNTESCPFCKAKNSMRMIQSRNGYKKVCSRCKFSVEVEDKDL